MPSVPLTWRECFCEFRRHSTAHACDRNAGFSGFLDSLAALFCAHVTANFLGIGFDRFWIGPLGGRHRIIAAHDRAHDIDLGVFAKRLELGLWFGQRVGKALCKLPIRDFRPSGAFSSPGFGASIGIAEIEMLLMFKRGR